MNIVYFAHESRLGGANLSLLGLIEEMRRDNNVYVIVPIKTGFLVDELKKREIPYLYVHSFWWMLAPAGNTMCTFLKKNVYRVLVLYNYLCALYLSIIIKKWRVDIIHTNSSVINTGSIVAHLLKIPHVWHIREFGQEDFNFFSVWKYNRICRYINLHSDKVIAISKAIYEKFEDKIDVEKLVIIYNGIGEKYLQEKKAVKEKGDTINFLISGRISQEKGQEEAINAIKILKQKGYKNVHLYIAGPGNQSALVKLIEQKEIKDKVTFLGVVSEMCDLRKNMDVELVCSKCEAFGRVTIEAMMSSNPVIGTNTGGTKELIREGENGYLYELGNVKELAERMQFFLENPDKMSELGRKAYSFSKNRFSQKRNAELIGEVYCNSIKLY